MEKENHYQKMNDEAKEKFIHTLKISYSALDRFFPVEQKEIESLANQILDKLFSPPQDLGLDENGNPKNDRVNIYTDGVRVIVTRDINVGTTSLMVRDPDTKQMLRSMCYIVPQDIEPTAEWYKPSQAEIRSLNKEYREHVLKGGLMLRKIGEKFKEKFSNRIKENLRKSKN